MLRALAHYFLIGGLLFGAKTAYETRRIEGPEITVRVPATASEVEVDDAVREAILLHEARRYGWDRQDPVVFGHLVRNMRFIEPDSTEDDLTLYQRALDMNMHRHDPIVRARLLYRAREALAYVPESEMPSRQELETHRAEHPERFERERRIRFQHVFLSRSKRGDALAGDASAMRDELDALGDAPPTGFGDPLPGLRAEQVSSPSDVARDYGPDLSDALSEALIGAWRGPVSSVYGLHFVRVLEEQPARTPPLTVIGEEVRADLLRDIKQELREERMEALLDAYTVNIERVP